MKKLKKLLLPLLTLMTLSLLMFAFAACGSDKSLAEGIVLDKNEATVEVDGTLQLTPIIVPDEAAKEEVVWSVSEDSDECIEVTQSGLVTGKKVGFGTVICTVKNNSELFAECSIEVTPKRGAEIASYEYTHEGTEQKSVLTFYEGDGCYFIDLKGFASNTLVLPVADYNNSYTISTEQETEGQMILANRKIGVTVAGISMEFDVIVDQYKINDQAEITFKVNNGTVDFILFQHTFTKAEAAAFGVNVDKLITPTPVESITIAAPASTTLKSGQVLDIGALVTVSPANATFKDIKIESEKPDVFKVSGNSVIAIKSTKSLLGDTPVKVTVSAAKYPDVKAEIALSVEVPAREDADLNGTVYFEKDTVFTANYGVYIAYLVYKTDGTIEVYNQAMNGTVSLDSIGYYTLNQEKNAITYRSYRDVYTAGSDKYSNTEVDIVVKNNLQTYKLLTKDGEGKPIEYTYTELSGEKLSKSVKLANTPNPLLGNIEVTLELTKEGAFTLTLLAPVKDESTGEVTGKMGTQETGNYVIIDDKIYCYATQSTVMEMAGNVVPIPNMPTQGVFEVLAYSEQDGKLSISYLTVFSLTEVTEASDN